MRLNQYNDVLTRFLRPDERLIKSKEEEMPLVIQADKRTDLDFLQQFLTDNSADIIKDITRYGAVLLRGFDVTSDESFEKTVLSIPEFRGISEAFMAENGRVHAGNSRFVLHTNAIYKTGGTLYLGGFHTENYYSADVPGYISFCCFEPSTIGGETGLINTEKLYQTLSPELKEQLEKNTFFVGKWLVSEVAKRYKISSDAVKKICEQFQLPIVGEGTSQLILMYKPSVFEHPLNQEKALQINLFELPALNKALRACFMDDYSGKAWFWHRFFWKLPTKIFNSIEHAAVAFIAFFHSPKKSFGLLRTKYNTYKATKKNKHFLLDAKRVQTCFTQNQVEELAQSMRDYYCSCIWNKGDILLVDNRKVMHAGMPGIGPRLIRAMICNPIDLQYTHSEKGCVPAADRTTGAIGEYMTS